MLAHFCYENWPVATVRDIQHIKIITLFYNRFPARTIWAMPLLEWEPWRSYNRAFSYNAATSEMMAKYAIQQQVPHSVPTILKYTIVQLLINSAWSTTTCQRITYESLTSQISQLQNFCSPGTVFGSVHEPYQEPRH